jgi:GNAT superfamily N-acetyltransferase
VLRTLPKWFGIEGALLEYANHTLRLPTFVIRNGNNVLGFISLESYFDESWEVNCIAVDYDYRNRGLGRKLHETAEAWLVTTGVALLQVKTLAASHPGPEYAETRKFYESMGYKSVEIFTTLWGPDVPVLQLD